VGVRGTGGGKKNLRVQSQQCVTKVTERGERRGGNEGRNVRNLANGFKTKKISGEKRIQIVIGGAGLLRSVWTGGNKRRKGDAAQGGGWDKRLGGEGGGLPRGRKNKFNSIDYRNKKDKRGRLGGQTVGFFCGVGGG